MCYRRCSCVEPSDPTNGTLKYWEMNNITASEIYWEALEVKVLSDSNEANVVMGSLYVHSRWNYCITQRQSEKNTFGFSTLKWHALPDGGSGTEEIKGMWAGLYWITKNARQITIKAHFFVLSY